MNLIGSKIVHDEGEEKKRRDTRVIIYILK